MKDIVKEIERDELKIYKIKNIFAGTNDIKILICLNLVVFDPPKGMYT